MNIQLLLSASPSQGNGMSASQATGAQSLSSNGLFRQAMLQANEGQPRLPQELATGATSASQASAALKEFASLLESLGIELDQEELATLLAQLHNAEQPSADQLAALPGMLSSTGETSPSALDEISSRLALVAAFSDATTRSHDVTAETVSIADIAEQLAISQQDAAALVAAYQQLAAGTDADSSRKHAETLNQQIAVLLSNTTANNFSDSKSDAFSALQGPKLQETLTSSESFLLQNIDITDQLSLSSQDAASLVADYLQPTENARSIYIEALYQRLTSLFSATELLVDQTAIPSTVTAPNLQTNKPNFHLVSEAMANVIEVSNGAKNPITLRNISTASEALLSKQDSLMVQLSLIFGNTVSKDKPGFSMADIAEQLEISQHEAALLVTAYQQLTANTGSSDSLHHVETLNPQIAAMLKSTIANTLSNSQSAISNTIMVSTLPHQVISNEAMQSTNTSSAGSLQRDETLTTLPSNTTPPPLLNGKSAASNTLTVATMQMTPPHQGISNEIMSNALTISNVTSVMSERFGSAGDLAFNLPDTANSTNPAPIPIAAPMRASLPSSIGTPVSHPAWPSQLGQQLVQFAQRGGEQHIQMKLHPAELGPLSISLKMTEHGAQAHFLSAHAQVRQVLEQAIPQLRDALAEQGISLGETSVGEQNASNEQAFARQGNGGGGLIDGNDVESNGPTATLDSTPVTLDGRVDLYA